MALCGKRDVRDLGPDLVYNPPSPRNSHA